jgi:hypothetical protein
VKNAKYRYKFGVPLKNQIIKSEIVYAGKEIQVQSVMFFSAVFLHEKRKQKTDKY